MKYLCLTYEEEERRNALSRSEWDALRGETLRRGPAEERCGVLLRPMRQVPGMGRLCLFTDPEGRMLGLWQTLLDHKSP